MRSTRGRRGIRQARHRPQAPGQGRRRGHTRRGGGLHGQGHRADGAPRHRRGAARGGPPGSRRGGHLPHPGGGSVQRGESAAAGLDGERAALSGGAARGGRRAGRGGHRARVRLRPGPRRTAVHIVAAAGGQPVGACCGPRGRASRSRRTGGRGCTGSPCGCTSGWSRPRRGRRSRRTRRAPRRRPRGRRLRSSSPIAATRVDQAYAEVFPQIGRARRAQLSGSGYAAGAHAGSRADLGGRRGGAHGRRALDG